ncbi:MAG: hypothetical protein Q4G49_00565 [Paracoccus sp. (in: a-proteobacteria)]|nr:hypothetical protein [Paracoccus sp. (in: a-proteobacteria)]
MPEAEAAHLKRVYSDAAVILEYGSGGSTELGARMPGKYIMSVESDREWARNLREKLSAPEVVSPVIVHHADVGRTGPWGKPMDTQAWRRFPSYPNEVWDQTWFRHPDVVLIDGRFRTACFATTLIRAEKPVLVLFDDYSIRPLYHQIEAFLKPRSMIGRMAEFWVEPGQIDRHKAGLLIRQFFQGATHGEGEDFYQAVP